MTMKRCKADLHYFDGEKHETCPYCHLQAGESNDFTEQKPVDEEETLVTRKQVSPQGGQEKTLLTRKQIFPQAPENATIGLFKTEKEFSPVVGWLVCLEGVDKGKDYRIKPGINKVGREDAPDIEIVITGDQSISRRDHAEIEYDPEENIFYLIRKKNQAVKVNNLKVRQPVKLKPDDIIQFGKTKFIFSPLCSEKFKWTIE